MDRESRNGDKGFSPKIHPSRDLSHPQGELPLAEQVLSIVEARQGISAVWRAVFPNRQVSHGGELADKVMQVLPLLRDKRSFRLAAILQTRGFGRF